MYWISLSFSELFLAPNDLKKLLEFEERCVAGYFRDKHESQHCSQINRIRHAADKCVSPPKHQLVTIHLFTFNI